MRPLIFQKAGDTPQHTERFKRSRCSNAAAIEGFPSKLADNVRDLVLCLLAVPAKEHGRCTFGVLRIDHACIAHAVKSLHDARSRKFCLNSFTERIIRPSEILQYPVYWRSIRKRVGSIDDRFTREVVRTRLVDRSLHGTAERYQHD